ncbi:MAG TPA: FTR1 family protein [Gemmatimonadaceae bacterium]|nr:FTR1 family protein [Gemmatimonadaceae bacterium]
MMSAVAPPRPRSTRARTLFRVGLVVAALCIAALLIWQALAAGGTPDPLAPGSDPGAKVLDIAVLVFREGLECILVLAAITASMVGTSERYQRPIAAGAAVAFGASLLTWFVAVRIIDHLAESIPALKLQAITGFLAIIVLLVVMNWFFHKVYWTGWISLHNRRKKALLATADEPDASRARIVWGLALLGFTSLYREGFEVVLFLQNYRLKLGGATVLSGVAIGVLLAGAVAVLTFVAHHRLPYRKMLVGTGVMLGFVLLVMVGEQAQEMQLAHWLPSTPVPALASVIPSWAGLWFAVFPTLETLTAQLIAAALVVGSYLVVHLQLRRARRVG